MIVNWPAVREAHESIKHAMDYLSGDDPKTDDGITAALDCLDDADKALDKAMEER